MIGSSSPLFARTGGEIDVRDVIKSLPDLPQNRFSGQRHPALSLAA
jgi:hypothetical protein